MSDEEQLEKLEPIIGSYAARINIRGPKGTDVPKLEDLELALESALAVLGYEARIETERID